MGINRWSYDFADRYYPGNLMNKFPRTYEAEVNIDMGDLGGLDFLPAQQHLLPVKHLSLKLYCIYSF